ncbi:hypothetical protein DCS_04755 [Drechmeria coniospora]|uniref:Uncharacterized protein n=1 Tax=Drechmeria coniospora TaxID=98403 RepID=A0A151GL58_DRECN|nr:hypothetical protein DCS_04755 [Drechmeria coniospora]KYK57742.1 hypothetical protein DCS_04755 [Drechmeria coniospora]
MADNMSYIYTIGGYATLIGLGYALYHVSTQKASKRGSTPASRTVKAPLQEVRKEGRKKKQRLETFASDAAEPAGSKLAPKAEEEATSRVGHAAADTSDDEADNREFARQLAKAKEGTTFASSKSAGSKQREKSVKQSRANRISAAAAPSAPPAPSSATDADAEDDQSSRSPSGAGLVDASGVADMLEPTPTGPAILRITDSEPKKEQKKKAVGVPEKAETKKQRQNRKKAEAAKAAREEAEKDRKVLEEKQRRAARIAEGRAAKDGTQFQAAVKANSVWAPGVANGTHASKAPAQDRLHQPLDTFEKPAPAAAPQPAPVKPESSWMSSLPSEEEQLEMLKGEADEWSTVPTKASKKAAKKPSSVSSADEKWQTQPAAQAKQPAAPHANKASRPSAAKNFGGSFSALDTNGDDVEEAEEEWDV